MLRISLIGSLVFLAAIFPAHIVSAQIINIDFLVTRGGATSANYEEAGAAGGGNFFNGLLADNTEENDNITVTGSNLTDSNGKPTTVGFTISPVGADNKSGFLNGGYLFINSGKNYFGYPDEFAGGKLYNSPSQGVSFKITGLGSAKSVDIYFYVGEMPLYSAPAISFDFSSDEPHAAFTPSGIFTAKNTIKYANILVAGGGVVEGVIYQEMGLVELVNGLTIVVPTPAN